MMTKKPSRSRNTLKKPMPNRNMPQKPILNRNAHHMSNNAIQMIYQDEKMLFYLRTHPEWYRILGRYPNQYQEFIKIAKEELKLTTFHKIERFKNQVSLLGMLSEYMKRS